MKKKKRIGGKRKVSDRAKAAQRRLKRMKEKRGSGVSGVFKTKLPANFQQYYPQEGLNKLDIVEYKSTPKNYAHDKEEPIVHCFPYYCHNDLGIEQNKRALCLTAMYNKPCPVCEKRLQMKEEGVEWEDYKHLNPRERNIYNVIVRKPRSEEKKGVQVMDLAYMYLEEHLETLSNVDEDQEPFIDYSAPDETGRTISFKVKKQQGSFPKYTGHKLLERDYVITEEELEEAFIIDDLVHIPTYEEVKELFEGGSSDSTKPSTRKEKKRKVKEEDEDDMDEDDVDEDDVDNECEYGGVFGVDIDELEECEECDCYDQCEEMKEENKKKSNKKNKKKKDTKKKSKKRKVEEEEEDDIDDSIYDDEDEDEDDWDNDDEDED